MPDLDLTADWDARLAWAHAHRHDLHVQIDGARRVASLTHSDESRAVLRDLLGRLDREYRVAHPVGVLDYGALESQARATLAASTDPNVAPDWMRAWAGRCAENGVALLARVRELEAENDRLRAERAAALTVATTGGMTASEWVLRTGMAERARDALRAALHEACDRIGAMLGRDGGDKTLDAWRTLAGPRKEGT